MWGNTLEGATSAFRHTAFISAQICFLDIPFPLLVRKISPEAIFCCFTYFFSFLHSFPGIRMVRSFPFSEISARPEATASTVIYRTSLTRIPVAQMVSISSASRLPPQTMGRGKETFVLISGQLSAVIPK